jgi:DNA transformation protein
MPVSESFLDTVRDLIRDLPQTRIKRMFGGAGVFSGELMFALVFEEDLYLRADADNRAAFEAEGLGPFTYRARDGAEMTLSYWRAPEAVWDDAEAARTWFQASVDAALRHKAARRGPRKSPKRQALLIPGPWDGED